MQSNQLRQVIVSRKSNSTEGEGKYQSREYAKKSEAIAKQSIVVVDVKFVNTGDNDILDYENGFGCNIAAVGQEAEQVEVGLVGKLEPVKFQHDRFCLEDGTRLVETPLFVCTPSGIFAVRV